MENILKCPKCESLYAQTKYRKKGETIDSNKKKIRIPGKARKELLFHVCTNCGYCWTTDTKDNQRKKEFMEEVSK